MLDISVIIPFKDKAKMTLECVTTLQAYGGNIKEILLVSNNSSDSEKAGVERAVSGADNVKLLTYDHPFNYQKINNWAAKQASGKVLMLLNNDIELVSHSVGLLETMYQEALREKVGAVGCVLLYGDNKTVQHAGVYLVPSQTGDHLYIGKNFQRLKRQLAENKDMYDTRHNIRVSAVTAAAMMVEKRKYDQIGGLDESFIICGGDVDVCLRLEDAGYHNTLIGSDHGYMIHKESKSRSMINVPYVDFVRSYESYVKHFSLKTGDKHLHWQKVRNASR